MAPLVTRPTLVWRTASHVRGLGGTTAARSSRGRTGITRDRAHFHLSPLSPTTVVTTAAATIVDVGGSYRCMSSSSRSPAIDILVGPRPKKRGRPRRATWTPRSELEDRPSRCGGGRGGDRADDVPHPRPPSSPRRMDDEVLYRSHATCLPGLEGVLSDELRSLGVDVVLEENDVFATDDAGGGKRRRKGRSGRGRGQRKERRPRGEVEFLATKRQILTCVHWLGSVTRVLVRCPVSSSSSSSSSQPTPPQSSEASGTDAEGASSSSSSGGDGLGYTYTFRAMGLAELRRKVSKMIAWGTDDDGSGCKGGLLRPRRWSTGSTASPSLSTNGSASEGRLAKRVNDEVPLKRGGIDDEEHGIVDDRPPPLDEEDSSSGGIRLEVRARSSKSRLIHTGAIEERVELGVRDAVEEAELEEAVHSIVSGGFDVIVDHDDSSAEDGLSGTTDDDAPPLHLVVSVYRDEVSISMDASSGLSPTSSSPPTSSPIPPPLHRRGYRIRSAKAPLREDIAFALLRVSGLHLHRDCSDDGGAILVLDPFCGSGTIAIEAAMMLLGLAPGRLRDCGGVFHAPMRGAVLHDPDLWREIVTAGGGGGEDLRRHRPTFRVVASDRDAGAVEAAVANAERAGPDVASAVEFHCRSASDSFEHVLKMLARGENEDGVGRRKEGYGAVWVVTNPPFGRRLSSRGGEDEHHLLPLYQTIGKYVNLLGNERCLGGGRRCRLGMLAHDVGLARRVGVNTGMTVGFSTTHGGLSVVGLVSAMEDCKGAGGGGE